MAELFDDISRIVGSQVPRRQTLKLIMGLFAGGILGLLVDAPLAAKTAEKGKCYSDFFCNTPLEGANRTKGDCFADTGGSWCAESDLEQDGETCKTVEACKDSRRIKDPY